MLKKIVILGLLLVGLHSMGWAEADFYSKDKVSYDFSYTLTARNDCRQRQRVYLKAPLLRTLAPYQEVTGVKLTPDCDQIMQDSRGNKWVEWSAVLKPGQVWHTALQAKVTVQAGYYELQASKLKALSRDRWQPYLQQEPGIEVRQPAIQAQARAITQGLQSPYYKVIAIYDWVRENLRFNLELPPTTAAKVLERRIAQCSDATLLMMALCRAQGVPCRYVNGIHRNEGEEQVKLTHAWMEFYLPPYGWVPADPTLGRQPGYRLSAFGELKSAYIIFNRDEQYCFSLKTEKVTLQPKDLQWQVKARIIKQQGWQPASVLKPLPHSTAARNQAPASALQPAVAALKARKYETAARLLSSTRMPPSAQTYLLLGQLYFQTKQLALARRNFYQALSLNPQELVAYGYLADVLTYEERWEDLRGFCAQALSRIKHPYFVVQQGYALTQQAKYLEGNDAKAKFAQALPYFAQGVKLEPQVGWNKAMLGWCYLMTGKSREGKKLIREGLAQGQGFDDPRFFQRLLQE